MKIFKYSTLALLSFVALLCLYEASAVIAAQNKTSEVRSNYLGKETLDITLQNVPSNRVEMMLKIQDPNFYSHKGIDYSTPGAGLTTLTQALAKFLYFENFKPGFLKIEQTLIARFVIDRSFTKEEQLTIFYNYSYLGQRSGQGIRGFSNAAKAYFNTEFSALSEEQYLSLVAMLVAPNSFNVDKNPKENSERVARIRDLLNGLYKPTELTDVFYDKNA